MEIADEEFAEESSGNDFGGAGVEGFWEELMGVAGFWGWAHLLDRASLRINVSDVFEANIQLRHRRA